MIKLLLIPFIPSFKTTLLVVTKTPQRTEKTRKSVIIDKQTVPVVMVAAGEALSVTRKTKSELREPTKTCLSWVTSVSLLQETFHISVEILSAEGNPLRKIVMFL